MKKTTTRRNETWTPCTCKDPSICPLCEGAGKFLSGIFTETIIEDIPEPEEIIDAEEYCPELEHRDSQFDITCFDEE